MSSNSTENKFDDPIFYVHLAGIIFYAPSLILQTILLLQIRSYKLTNALSASLMLNLYYWWFLMLIGLFMGRFFVWSC
jgi:hypothetical protein